MVLADLSPRKIMRIHNSECHTFLQAGYIVFIYQKILLTWSCLSVELNTVIFNGILYWRSMNDLQNYILRYQFDRLLLRLGQDKWGKLIFGHLSLWNGFGLCTRTHPVVSHSRLQWTSWCLWRLTLQAIARAFTRKALLEVSKLLAGSTLEAVCLELKLNWNRTSTFIAYSNVSSKHLSSAMCSPPPLPRLFCRTF